MEDSRAESGIEIDFGSLLSNMEEDLPDLGENFEYGELKSSSFVDTPIAPVELKNVQTPLKVNLKMQLQKQQAQQDLERQQLMNRHSPCSQSTSSAINMPITVSALTSDLPASSLKYQTKLLHPTKYHVKQVLNHQTRAFASQSLRNAGSMPNHQNSMHNSHPYQPRHTSSSSMPDPTSPLSVLSSSAASNAGSEVDELLGDILELQAVDPSASADLDMFLMNSHLSTTLPQDPTGSVPELINPNNPTSASAPNPADHELVNWAKDRQKKDNHNQIERRRRYNINDRIKELGTLLPNTSDPDFRQNKGSILRASVDYIRDLRTEHHKVRKLEEKLKETERQNRMVMLRLQQCEMMLQQSGMISNDFMAKPNVPIKVEPVTVHLDEEMEGTDDPMLSSVVHN